MMRKLQLLAVAVVLMISVNVNAGTIKNSKLNLNNPDIRKCLINTTQSEGWELTTVYLNSNNKLVMIFDKGSDSKVYTSRETFSN